MKVYDKIVKHYENCLKEHGDSHLGVDWPNIEDAYKRYNIMLDIIRVNYDLKKEISLLDFGCGTAALLDYIKTNNINNISYTGLDISKEFVKVAKEKFSDVTFLCGDILDSDFKISRFDYVIMNGVFTEKRNLSFDEMWMYFKKMLLNVFNACDRGIAFNVMSKNVDWERNDLFHVPLDLLTHFLTKNISRNFLIRNDYGLYEYTVYLYKESKEV